MSKSIRWILIVLGVLVVLLFVYRISRNNNEGVKVSAAMVKRNTIVESVSASGKIFPELEVKVGAGLTGEVTDLYIKEGDTVKKGQVLARLLSEPGRTSAPRITGTDFNSIIQNLQAPPSTTSRTTHVAVTAPINGTVSMLNVKKGERVGGMAMGGAELMRIADMKTMEVRVDVNENDIIKVSVGDSADVDVEAYNKRKFKGVVTYIANSTTRRETSSFIPNDITSYEVHIRIDSSTYKDLIDPSRPRRFPFRPGMNARAEIKTQKKVGVLAVPVASVTSAAKESDDSVMEKKDKDVNENDSTIADAADDVEEVVFVINNDNVVHRRVVTTGIQDINNIEILSGLKEGEKVVTGPYNAVSKTLRSGTKVTVVSKDELFEK
ncbi:MAG: efflux RND transporter periplasmic adaptor subunit [Candidatus Dadabacteria bacterium]